MCISVIGITEVSVKIFKLSNVEEIGAFLLFLSSGGGFGPIRQLKMMVICSYLLPFF